MRATLTRGWGGKDINNSGDGGIYAELITNRAFQYSELYPVNLSGWRPINSVLKLDRLSTPLSSALPVSMNVAPSSEGPRHLPSSSSQEVGFLNEGYWGMDVKKQKYTGSFWVKGSYHGTFTASLRSNLTSQVFGTVEVPSKATSEEWTEHEFTVMPHTDAPNSNNTFAVTFDPSVSNELVNS
jgi:alpha-N-arabinofuranosidase